MKIYDILDSIAGYTSQGCVFRIARVNSECRNIIMGSHIMEMMLAKRNEKLTRCAAFMIQTAPCSECNENIVFKQIYGQRKIDVCMHCMFEVGNYHERVNIQEAAKIIQGSNHGFMIKQRKLNALKYCVRNGEKLFLKSDVMKLAN